LDIKEGEILGLLGPNGSGKTTTINCLLSLLKYDKGTVEIFGKPMTPDSYDIKRNIGIVSQNVAVFDELTVYGNIDYFCGLYIKGKAEREQLIQEALAFTELSDYKKFYPKKLSGGLLRRLNIACGITHKPKLIIMDEPTVAVDPQSRNHILQGIIDLNKNGATIVYTSHYMEEVEQICSRIVIMDKGRNLADGTKEELKMMIKTGETIRLEILDLSDNHIEAVKTLAHIFSVDYEGSMLTVRCRRGSHNLVTILNYLTQNNIACGRVLSELPTLNDVFLEITGKDLRD
jgi:ABC-2 type transport system ATP-binding protein